MAVDNNKLELVIEVQADKANAQIKGPTESLAGIDRIAASVAQNPSQGVDGMTASMVKGSLAAISRPRGVRGCGGCRRMHAARPTDRNRRS